MPVINGTIQWAHVQKPSQFDKYSVEVLFGPKVAETLQDLGLGKKIKETEKDEEKAIAPFKIKFDSNAKYKDGNPTPKPTCIDRYGEPVTCNIGNGTTANVQFTVNEGRSTFGPYIKGILKGVQVVDLIEYTGGDEVEFKVESRSEKPLEDDLPY